MEDPGEQTRGGPWTEHTPQHLTRRARMSSTSNNIFIVPYEVFQALDPIEKIVIRAQEARGEVRIAGEPKEEPR